jgi:hypothetical protein
MSKLKCIRRDCEDGWIFEKGLAFYGWFNCQQCNKGKRPRVSTDKEGEK